MGEKIKIIIIALSIVLLPRLNISAADGLFYKELNLIAGYSDRDHWIDKNSMMASSLGFEYYRKFSGEYGDYLTADLQMRVAYDSLANSHDAWGVEIHNAWLEYKIIPEAKLRVGHFDSPFGLEPVVDTHATLLQTLAEENIGFKQDWGAELKGFLPNFDYEVALQIGSGMSIRRRDNSYLATLRLGTAQGRNLQGGFSLLSGRVLESEGMRTFPKNKLSSKNSVDKKRIGLDGQYLFGPLLFKGEFTYGQNDKNDVLGYLAEIDYTLPSHQNLEFELQYKSWINDIHTSSSEDSTLTLGVTYKLNQSTSLRAAFSHDFYMMETKPQDMIVVQFYFLGA